MVILIVIPASSELERRSTNWIFLTCLFKRVDGPPSLGITTVVILTRLFSYNFDILNVTYSLRVILVDF